MAAFEAGPNGVMATVWNDTGVPDGEVYTKLAEQHPEVAAIVRWASDSRGSRQSNSLFQRDRYVGVNGIMQKFRVAQEAVATDDVVSGVVETTESLAFGKVTVECDDADETSIWQQVADEIDLDSRIREMWREVFAISHVNMGTWWGFRNYKVDGKSDAGIKRKKTYNQLRVPVGLTVLDPLRVVPVGNTMFGQESLCLPADARVWTTRGPVRIEDVEVGQRVWSWAGDGLVESRISAKRQTGVKPIVAISTRHHLLRVSPEHPVLCLVERHGPIRYEWKPAGTIEQGDVLVASKSLPEVAVGSQGSIPTDWAYILGLMAGDGRANPNMGRQAASSDERWWSHVQKDEATDCWLWTGGLHKRGYGMHTNFVSGRRVQVMAARYGWLLANGREASGRLFLTCGEKRCVNPAHREERDRSTSPLMRVTDRYAGRVNKQFSLYPACHESGDWTEKIERTLDVSVTSKNYGTGCDTLSFRHEGLALWGQFMRDVCTQRRFPSWVWTSTYEVREAFMRGFLEADGHKDERRSSGHWSWNLGNRAMSEDARMLAVSLGWSTGVVRPVTKELGVVWYCSATERARLNDIPNGFRNDRRFTLGTHTMARQVLSVAVEEPEPVWDIEVEGTHTFLAEGVVVHNCWLANRGETDRIDAVLAGLRASDPIIDQLLLQPYQPDPEEMRSLGELGIAFGKLYELNPATAFRHTDSKPQYQRFANVRMESIFPLLDMKNLLREMDRATLMGAMNYLVLVTKGDKDRPAKPEEITNLNNLVRTMARTPVIVGDDRLHVEIVSPKTDHTLTHDRYALLDNRISARLFQMFGVSNFQAGARSDNSITLARVIARGLEGRREQLRRAIEKYVLLPCWRYNEALVEKPRIVFQPKRVSLDFDPALMTALMDLGDRRQISRASLLDELGFDEENEARLLQMEKERFDDIFDTVIPGATGLGGGAANARSAGRRMGGTKNGGGNTPGTNNQSDPGQPDSDPGSS